MSNSENYLKLLANFTPCGSQTLSKMASRYPSIYPKVLEKGLNGHVFDVDGAEYIDLISGLGCISVGYAIPEINQAVIEQLGNGVTFSLPNRLEYEAAKRLTELVPCTDMWKFGKNGTDGTVMAVRAARAYTNRDKILSVGYNGCADQFEVIGARPAGIPQVLAPLIHKAVYNDIETFQCLRDETYACLIMEPMINEYPKLDFLQAIRDLCNETGTVLIFDEVVTGGRFTGFAATNHFEVVPDLIVLGKALANGFPLCAVGGRRSIMQTFERGDFFASGTFGAETLSLKACLSTVSLLEKGLAGMLEKGHWIQDAFNHLPWPEDSVKCAGFPTRLSFEFPTLAHKYLFWQEMCKQGVLVGYTNFIMASHTGTDALKIIKAIRNAHHFLKAHWTAPADVLLGDMPTAAIRK